MTNNKVTFPTFSFPTSPAASLQTNIDFFRSRIFNKLSPYLHSYAFSPSFFKSSRKHFLLELIA